MKLLLIAFGKRAGDDEWKFRTFAVQMKKVAFHTLGCKLNFSETSTIARMFEEQGYQKVDFKEASDIYVINTSRGKCLNAADLVSAISSGKVLGACLDVLEYESISFENLEVTSLPEPMQYLIKSDKVVLSPHIAGWTHESNYKISKFLAEKMIAVLKK